MCGINGILGSDRELVKQMNKILHHRGPDQQGIFADSNVTLGSCRLAVIDLSPKGRMPMHNAKETLWIIQNGEIYNFRELREELQNRGHTFSSDSDTEVILNAYDEWGASCVERLNGEFAFCIYDRRKKQLFLARDRLGIKPLFYFHRGETFAFSSEMKALMLHPEVKRELDWNSLAAYLTFRYVPGENTIIKGIKRLLPGRTMLIDVKDPKKPAIKRFWEPSFEPKPVSTARAAGEVLALLEDSVRRRMVSDVPLGAFLSGGIDSTAMVALMCRNSEKPVKTFSVGFDEASFSEAKNSMLVADALNTDHTELTVTLDSAKVLPSVIWHLDDLMADPAAVPTYIMCEATKKHVTVALSGDGNDELFAGYVQYRILNRGRRYGALIPQGVKNMLTSRPHLFPNIPYIRRSGKLLATDSEAERFLSVMASFTPDEQEELLSEGANKDLSWDARKFVKPYFDSKLPPLHQWLKFDIENWLVEDILAKSDRMSLAHSLELRVPYLDHRYAELALSLPPEMKLRGNTEKWLFRQAVRDIVPKQILRRKKQGFALPINEWLDSGLRGPAEELFRVSPILNSSFFRQRPIHRIISQHQLSRKVYKRQFWSLLTLALWHKIHIEDATTDIRKVKTLNNFSRG